MVDAYVTIPMVNVNIIEEFIRPALERLNNGTQKKIPLMDTADF